MTLEAGLTHDLSWDTGHTLSMLTGIGVQPGGLEVQVLCPPGRCWALHGLQVRSRPWKVHLRLLQAATPFPVPQAKAKGNTW